MMNRRQFLQASAAVTALSFSAPGLSLGRTGTGKSRFILIILRGGMDGLGAVPAYSDTHYQSLRGILALPPPGQPNGILDLNGTFGLHPALGRLHQRYQQGELSVIHGTAPPYRKRSHFDAQNVLESGIAPPHAVADGWLYRALAGVDPNRRHEDLAVAVGPSIPLVLRGDKSVGSWSPDSLPEPDEDTMSRILTLYRNDAVLAPSIEAMLAMDSMMSGAPPPRARGNRMQPLTLAAARLLSEPDGPRIAVLESNGWDTHAGQGAATGHLANRLRGLDGILASLYQELGPVWDSTAILAVSEFGRTVAANGTRGTDHGIGGAAFLLGGAVQGGHVVADWQGLDPARLQDRRDLPATIDQRQIFKAVLADHLGADEGLIDEVVFPSSPPVQALPGLFKPTAGASGSG